MLKKNLRRIKRVAEKTLGLEITRVFNEGTFKAQELPHSRVLPSATYSPWKNDAQFRDVYEIAKDYTLVDEYRMFEIYQLASQAARIEGDFLEVGVWRGGTSAIIQTALSNCQSDCKFYIADTFQGVAKAGTKEDNVYKGGEHSDADISDVEELFKKIDENEPEILIGIFPDDHKQLNIESLAFVHSDVDAYASTKGVIEWCLPKMVKGGIIVFDDYGFNSCEGVTKYVNQMASDSEISQNFRFIHNLNGHAILIKIS